MRRLISMITLTAAAALSACSSGSPNATGTHAHSTTPTRPAATTNAANNATPQTPITIATTSTSTSTTATATGSSFCPTVRHLGLDNLGIGQKPTSAPDHLLRNLDKLDAIAPPAIRADFDTFTKLEHALVGKTKPAPGDLAKLNSPGVARSLRHVGDYLRVNCGIGKS